MDFWGPLVAPRYFLVYLPGLGLDPDPEPVGEVPRSQLFQLLQADSEEAQTAVVGRCEDVGLKGCGRCFWVCRLKGCGRFFAFVETLESTKM